ncbi:transporter [Halorubrum vacuolatum]|uniref:DUF7978 domain-containing protein n=1 Tax=Halorubrum vacuolatum TaxID=63740 RepID=A0A238VT83_HALVU|nr:transporter [Halorubrum vacuolatum]SNR37391.1 hypothetical protein SAMN06264855_10433 [Halorubrum vacuolatum]
MSLTDRLGARSIAAGGVGGVAAYVLGYLFVYITQRSGVEEQLEAFNAIADLFGGDPIPAWQAIGWLFYNAHFVATEVPQPLGGVRVENFVASADGLSYLYVVPPLLLVIAGVATARVAVAETPTDGAAAGALVTAGYLPAAIAGAFLFRYAVGDATVTPDLVTAVLLAGAAYPLVFGAIGGAAASLLGGRE